MANSTPTSPETFQRKNSRFCEMRLSPLLQPRSIENLSSYMLALIGHRAYPPMKSGKLDWQEIALACDLSAELTAEVKRTAQHGFDAIADGSQRASPMTRQDIDRRKSRNPRSASRETGKPQRNWPPP